MFEFLGLGVVEGKRVIGEIEVEEGKNAE